MGKVFFDIGVSLDGYIAGENSSPKNPLGNGGFSIHQWMFNQKAFWETHNIESGNEDSHDGELIRMVFARTGAYIMGKRMFEEGEPNWPEDLYKAPVYVLTHERRDPWVQKGKTTYYFVNDGIHRALELARATCEGKDIRLQGGADMIQQYLNAGFVDEFTLHIAAVLIGSGIRLFDKVDRTRLKFISAVTIAGDAVMRNSAYYIIAHASKFVRPGSKRIDSNIPDGLPNVAYTTPS